jgi:hypothetical protein
MAKKETTKPGWNIPVDVRDSFTAFCAGVGAIAQEDCAGALLIWPHLPAEIREQAKVQAKGNSAIDKKFWQQFRSGLELALQARSNILQEKRDKKKAP